MTWFEKLTGCSEDSIENVRKHLTVEGTRLSSRLNGQSWVCGELQIPTLAHLRECVHQVQRDPKTIAVSEVVANVQKLHADSANTHALFQVASQFNLLEMVSPGVTPERGVGIYENDFTQGPACAIAAGAGTIYRNYFVNVHGHVGQSADHQIDCLAGVGALLGNTGQRMWKSVNGYALPTAGGLKEINQRLANMDEFQVDRIRQALQIGLQWNTQVTLDSASHTVSQAYCSAMPVAYTGHDSDLWAPFAKLVLDSAYEATICAAILNAERTGDNRLFLTMLGGGAFGNEPDWIVDAMRRSLDLYFESGLDIVIVSYGRSNQNVQQLLAEFDGRDLG